MKKPPDKGTVEWFKQARRRCVDNLRALLSIKTARYSATAILRDWNSQSAESRSALHSACVISYARPFVSAFTNVGKVTYPPKKLMATSGFDKELHIHILDLRNQIIAHGDYCFFPSTMYVQTAGDERLPISLDVNVKGMFGIESHELALRYEKHLSICDKSLEKILNGECNELASEARIHPSEFHGTHNIPVVGGSFKLDSELKYIEPVGTVENPVFPQSFSGYRYVTLTHQIPLLTTGTYTITEDGVATRMAWFLNFFKCDRCKRRWTDEWSCMCDDECPHCGAQDMTPYKSKELTTIIEEEGKEFIVFWSPETAEHDPDYRELGRFPSREKALEFLGADE
jgi:hypothetical protein